jgi:hypothetical protein
MNPLWPEKRSLMDTVTAVPRIKEALDWIAADITTGGTSGASGR